jgi:Uma2 family endonuclease
MQLLEQLTRDELQQRWQSVTEDEELAEYQGRAEIDAYGEVALTPSPALVHQLIANEFAAQIRSQLGGRAIVGCPVLVDGVFIADVAWLSGDRAASMKTPAAESPEIIVEIASPRNTKKGLLNKAARYLAHGTDEVVLVHLDGTIRFITAAGEDASSRFGLCLTLPPNTYPR